jgi:hypothetical protein
MRKQNRWTSFKYGCITSAFLMVCLLSFIENIINNIFRLILSILLAVCMSI